MEQLADIAQLIRTTASSTSSDKFSEAGEALAQARDALRDQLQDQTAALMKPIIRKLEKNQPLSDDEKSLIRTWIVGDAAAFTSNEKDYQEWLNEFRRLGESIGQSTIDPSSIPAMLDLYGSLEEAARLAEELRFFLEEKERVVHLEQALRNLSESDTKFLAGILKDDLERTD